MWAGLMLLLLLSWAGIAWQVWAAVTTSGTFFISGPSYKNVIPRGFKKHYVIGKKRMTTSDVLSAEAVLGCGRLCLASTNCSSILLKQDTFACILSSLNRCRTSDSILLHSPGSFFYERFDGYVVSPATCFSGCYAERGCRTCGRLNCWGSRCDRCATTCWETPANISGRTLLWTNNMKNIISTVCEGDWQLMWKTGDSAPRNTPSEPLELKLRLEYEGSVSVTSHFTSMKVKKERLSVGIYSGGEAGNWWKAPFNRRKLAFSDSSNCHPFFNPSKDCEANNVMRTEEQRRRYDTVVERGFAWLTDNDSYDSLKLLNIEMWMKCAECT